MFQNQIIINQSSGVQSVRRARESIQQSVVNSEVESMMDPQQFGKPELTDSEYLKKNESRIISQVQAAPADSRKVSPSIIDAMKPLFYFDVGTHNRDQGHTE